MVNEVIGQESYARRERPRWPLVASLVIALIILAFLAAFAWLATRSSPQRSAHPSPRPSVVIHGLPHTIAFGRLYHARLSGNLPFKQYVVVVSDNIDYAIHAARLRIRSDYAGLAKVTIYAADNRGGIPHVVAVTCWRGKALRPDPPKPSG